MDLRVIPLAEYRAANPDNRAAALDGYLVIARHAHADLGEVLPYFVGVIVSDIIEYSLDVQELLADFGVVVGVGRHAHHAAESDVGKLAHNAFRQQLLQLLDVEARLRVFIRHFKLEEAVHHPIVLCSLFIDLDGKFEAVDAVNHVHEGDDVFDFVGLQMPNLMPADVGGQLRLFLREFLHLVFAEVAASYIIKCHYVLDGLRLGDRKKRNVCRQLVADFGVFFCAVHCVFLNKN